MFFYICYVCVCLLIMYCFCFCFCFFFFSFFFLIFLFFSIQYVCIRYFYIYIYMLYIRYNILSLTPFSRLKIWVLCGFKKHEEGERLKMINCFFKGGFFYISLPPCWAPCHPIYASLERSWATSTQAGVKVCLIHFFFLLLVEHFDLRKMSTSQQTCIYFMCFCI